MTNATSNNDMNALHSQLAVTLKEEIEAFKETENVTDAETGKVVGVCKNKKGLAGLLNVARQFLKDNGIESRLTANSPLADLTESLPFPDEGDESDSSVKH